MAGAFLWDDKVVGALSLSALAGTPVPSMPLSNLLDPQPRMRARLLGSAASIVVDFGADATIEAAALISTTLPDSATVRWRLGAPEAFIEAPAAFDMRLADPASVAYPAGWTFTRSTAGWRFDSAGALAQAAADTPRFDYDPATLACRGLLLEEARTNSIRNPRAEGASAGSPGTAPTYWGGATGGGLTRTVVGTGAENGIPYIDVRWNGTASSSSNSTLPFDGASQIAAAQGQAWTASMFARLVGGSTANVSAFQLLLVENDSGGSSLVTNSAGFAPSVLPFGQSRPSFSATLSNASTAYVRPIFRFTFNSGAAIDFTLRIGAPQCELGTNASSPILPPVSAPAATARAADKAQVTGLAIGPGFALLVQSQASGAATLCPGGAGPASDQANSSWFTIASNGSAQWNPQAGGLLYNVAAVSGTQSAADTFVVAQDGSGHAWARSGVGRTSVQPWPMPAMNRASLGGYPWTDGAAIGTGWYRRFAFYAGRLLDSQVFALGFAGSSLVASAVVHDSGTLAAATGAACNGNVVLLRSAAASGRCMQIDVTAASAAFIDLGRLVAGPLWRPSHAHAYGIAEGRLILDRRDRNPLTGAEFPVPALANPRTARFSLPLLSGAEVRGQHRAMVAALGAAGDALWIPDTGLSQAELNARSLWGGVAVPGEAAAAVRDSSAGSSRAFQMTERV